MVSGGLSAIGTEKAGADGSALNVEKIGGTDFFPVSEFAIAFLSFLSVSECDGRPLQI